MVLPLLKPEMSRQEIIDAYITADWKKKLEFDWVYIDPRGEAHVKKMRFNADTIPCNRGDDSQHQLTFIQFGMVGVVWTCAICGKTDGPIADELGQALSDKQISTQEAWNIIGKTGQMPPLGLEKNALSRVRVREEI